jgi:hypothetical protein
MGDGDDSAKVKNCLIERVRSTGSSSALPPPSLLPAAE